MYPLNLQKVVKILSNQDPTLSIKIFIYLLLKSQGKLICLFNVGHSNQTYLLLNSRPQPIKLMGKIILFIFFMSHPDKDSIKLL